MRTITSSSMRFLECIKGCNELQKSLEFPAGKLQLLEVFSDGRIASTRFLRLLCASHSTAALVLLYLRLMAFLLPMADLISRVMKSDYSETPLSFLVESPLCSPRLLDVRTSNYNLWGVNVLALPRMNSSKYGLNSFSYCAAKHVHWNAFSALLCVP